jgi:hypothetical protein
VSGTGPAGASGLSEGAALVQTELEHGLRELDPVQFDVESELAEGPLRAVAWSYTARPREGESFLGVQLSTEFVLRGVTLIRTETDGRVLLRWYIDWLDAFNRAGLNAALRPVPDGPQPNLTDLLSLLR